MVIKKASKVSKYTSCRYKYCRVLYKIIRYSLLLLLCQRCCLLNVVFLVVWNSYVTVSRSLCLVIDSHRYDWMSFSNWFALLWKEKVLCVNIILKVLKWFWLSAWCHMCANMLSVKLVNKKKHFISGSLQKSHCPLLKVYLDQYYDMHIVF